MNEKELLAHVNDNIQSGREAGNGLTFTGKASVAPYTHQVHWDTPDKYTVSPNTVTINGIECVAGMITAPQVGEDYLVPSLVGGASYLTWEGYEQDYQFLKGKMMFPQTGEGARNAKAMSEAMQAFQ